MIGTDTKTKQFTNIHGKIKHFITRRTKERLFKMV